MILTRQIEAFRAVMLTGAMTTAAEMIQVSQPAVSRLVRDLEQQLGLTLFRRRGNLVVPTHEATALLAEVERSFVGLAQISAFADDLRRGRTGSLRVAALPTMAAGFAPRFIAEFCRGLPGLKVAIDGLSSQEVRDRVAAGRYDIGVAAFPFRHGVPRCNAPRGQGRDRLACWSPAGGATCRAARGPATRKPDPADPARSAANIPSRRFCNPLGPGR